MPLQKRTYDFPFVGGERQDIDARVLPFGTLKRVENRRYTKDGRLARRYGFATVSFTDTAGATITDPPVQAASLGDEKVVVGKAKVYSQLPSSPSDRWVDRGQHARVGSIVKRSVIKKADKAMQFIGAAYSGGYRVYAWTETAAVGGTYVGDAWMQVVDDATGGLVFRTNLQTGNATVTRVLAAGDYVYVFWIDTTASPHSLKYVSFNVTDTTPQASDLVGFTALSTNLLATLRPQYDVATMLISGTAKVYVAFHEAGGGSQRVEKRTANASLTLEANSTTTDVAGGNNACMGLFCDPVAGNEHVWLGYSLPATTDTRACRFSESLAARSGPFMLDNSFAADGMAVGRYDNTTAVFYYTSIVAAGGVNYLFTGIQTCSTAGVVGTQNRFYHVQPASKPFDYDGRQYVVFKTHSIEFQGLYCLCDCRVDLAGGAGAFHPPPEAFFGQGEASAYATFYPVPQAAPALATGKFLFAGASVHDIVWDATSIGGEYTGIAEWPLDFTDVRRFLPVQHKETLGWSGGLPNAFDGCSAHEMGFAYAPDAAFCKATDSASAGSLTPVTATYIYYFVYEWYDAKGQRHLSRPGPAEGLSHTLGVGKTAVDLRIQTLTLTNKWRDNGGPSYADEGTPIRILIYRNDASGGVWHLVQSFAVAAMPTNDTLTHSVTFTDGLAFAEAERNEAIYTTDGSQPNEAPGPLSHIVQHRDRLFGCLGDALFWTKRIVNNDRAPEWASLFTMVPIPGVEITALASFDATLIIFTADAIYLLSGEGPEDDGGGQQYQPPELHSSDVGCIEPRSIVLMREGLVFQSKRALELLPRGGGPAIPIGDAIADDYATYSEITSALVEPSQTQVRWSAMNAGRTASRIFCWDYSLPNGGAWSTTSSATLTTIASAVMWDDRYTYVRHNEAVILQETRTYADAGNWITATVETGDIRLGGLNGFGRIYKTLIQGEHRAAHKFGFEVSLDGGLTWGTKFTWNFGAPTAGAEMIVEHHNRVQRTPQLRLRITDAQADSGGPVDSEGAALNACSLVYGAAPGTRRVQESLRR